jgi:MFS transporter, FSR family, fosmidomycin resistance protein
MTSTAIDAGATRSTDFRVVGLVSAGHFVSHIYLLVLPPLFPFVRAEFGVSYTELGAAIALFNVISAVLQTPAGFLADRISARRVLIGGLLLGAVSLVGGAFAPSFYIFLVMFSLLGLANTVYHPADYALLSSRVSSPRMSQAYSVHIFAGFLGTAVAPAAMLLLAQFLGWRGAFLAAAALGFVVAATIMIFGDVLAGRDPARAEAKAEGAAPDWHVLMSLPVMLNMVFFILIALTGAGVQNYGVVALEALWGTSLSLATWALTAYLFMSAIAVLVGGIVSARTHRHDLFAVTGQALSALALLPIAFIDLGTAALLGFMALSGFFGGIIQPSRDMIVRAVTPPGAFGRVFGFVTTGFNIGGVIGPLIFGFLMDYGSPRSVFVLSALFALLSIPTILLTFASGARRQKAA